MEKQEGEGGTDPREKQKGEAGPQGQGDSRYHPHGHQSHSGRLLRGDLLVQYRYLIHAALGQTSRVLPAGEEGFDTCSDPLLCRTPLQVLCLLCPLVLALLRKLTGVPGTNR